MGNVDKRKKGFSTSLLLALITTIFLQRLTVILAMNYISNEVTRSRVERIQMQLDKINKHVVITIKSSDGDIIDCVNKRKQPALDHPLLKNHKIQSEPLEWPRVNKENEVKLDDKERRNEGETKEALQIWNMNGTRSCPKETIPIRRITTNDVLRAKHDNFSEFRKKQYSAPLDMTNKDIIMHEHATVVSEGIGKVYGAKAIMNVWNPYVESVDEFSISQLWISTGSLYDSDLNCVEAGWQVNPNLYGDNKPRLFIYWTRDSYKSTGCYNLLCEGFVQTNNKIVIGGSFSPISSYDGTQYELSVLIWKERRTRNWWLAVENHAVGYWPAKLFTDMSDYATKVHWGGEVLNTKANNRHTSTQMGSGQFAQNKFGKASYFRNIEMVNVDSSLESVDQDHISVVARNRNCYDIKTYDSNEWGTHFFYGGPGRNPLCP